MKYQVGQKVIYDSGDWRFYGTVTAVVENSIAPCYRLNVDRMEKKQCNLTITQFEFELTAEKSPTSPSEPDVIIPLPLQAADKAAKETLKEATKQKKVKTATKKPKPRKRKKSEVWYRNFENYLNGDKSNTIYTWVSQNRRLYLANALSKDKIEKLKEIEFKFEPKNKSPKKPVEDVDQRYYMSDAWWNHKFKQWETGDKEAMQQWQKKCVKLFSSGKLADDKVKKLKEIGILD